VNRETKIEKGKKVQMFLLLATLYLLLKIEGWRRKYREACNVKRKKAQKGD